MTKEKLASLFLRIGLAFVFFYAAVAALLDPFSWVGFFPGWLRALLPDELLLPAHSAAEIILALWLISGWRAFYSAVLASIAIGGIVIFNIGSVDIIFRDVAILFAAIALALIEKRVLEDRQ